MPYAIGDVVQPFTLPRAGGGTATLSPSSSLASVVIWTCNHCPYALAWHERVQSVIVDYSPRGVTFFQVNANDGEKYPADSFAAMEARVVAGEFASEYLHDSEQEISKSWGAKVTPDVFVVDSDGHLVYRGAPDADFDDAGLAASFLRAALDAVIAGEKVALAETKPVGCKIKWTVDDQPNPHL